MATLPELNPFLGTVSSESHDVATGLSKALAEELRKEDAKMAKDLVALAPHSGRSYQLDREGGASGAALASSTDHGVHGKGAAAADHVLEMRENMSVDAFIAKKREIGLVRMSLATKRSEIRKLDEEIDRAEKKLHQQQDQLESTREKFNNFLKHSNLEQDAAVRRADSETKAKQEKMVEIKKLSARINRTEASIRKTEVRVESCRLYKKFLDDLTKPRWFYDVLTRLRIEDHTQRILADTEGKFTTRAAQVTRQHEDHLAALQKAEQAQREHRDRLGTVTGPALHDSLVLRSPPSPAESTTLEGQLDRLHAELTAEAQAAVDAAAQSIRAEVDAMTIDEVRERLANDYDEARMPTYFTEVDQLLEVFINVEEGNLFLIQNCQELEEELERVAMDYMTEKEDMQAMTKQRHAQMEALAIKIRNAQAKLTQLDERMAILNTQQPGAPAASTRARGKTTGGGAGRAEAKESRSGGGGGGGHKGANGAASELTPEKFKENVERSIAAIFRTLTSGDNYIKQLTTAKSPRSATAGQTQAAEQTAQQPQQLAPSLQAAQSATTEDATESAEGRGDGAQEHGGEARRLAVPGHAATRASRPAERKKSRSAMGRKIRASPSSKQEAYDSNEAGANMGPIEMLTIIENKLEEYHRYIAEPTSGVDLSLIQSVMKINDKERRRQARHEHMIQQAIEQEERMHKALIRSQAPVVRRTGKPVLPRSHLLQAETTQQQQQQSNAAGGAESDEDGAEFFR